MTAISGATPSIMSMSTASHLGGTEPGDVIGGRDTAGRVLGGAFSTSDGCEGDERGGVATDWTGTSGIDLL